MFVTAFKPLIEFLIPIVSKVKDFFNNLGNGAKIFLSFVTAVALLVPGFKLLTTAVKFFGISAFLGFSKITSSLTGVGNRLITVEDLFTKGAKAMRGYKEAVQFTDNSILLSGRKRGNMPNVEGTKKAPQETSDNVRNFEILDCPVGIETLQQGPALQGCDACQACASCKACERCHPNSANHL